MNIKLCVFINVVVQQRCPRSTVIMLLILGFLMNKCLYTKFCFSLYIFSILFTKSNLWVILIVSVRSMVVWQLEVWFLIFFGRLFYVKRPGSVNTVGFK